MRATSFAYVFISIVTFLHANIVGPKMGIICHSLMLLHQTLSVAIIKAKINALA